MRVQREFYCLHGSFLTSETQCFHMAKGWLRYGRRVAGTGIGIALGSKLLRTETPFDTAHKLTKGSTEKLTGI